MSKLVVVVPRGRAFCGRAYVVGGDGAMRAGPFRALATASARVAEKNGNPECSTLLPFGHPPAGTYVIAASLPPGYAHRRRARRYGRVGAVLLAPTGGDALRARANGRKLIAIHAGPPDTSRRLRPTRGGIRLSNTHMRKLLAAINEAQHDGDPVASVELFEIELERVDERDRKGIHAIAPKKPPNVSSMVLLPFVLGGAGKSSVARRDLLRAAAVAFGALAIQACDRPSRCAPLACYPYDGDAGDAGDGGDAGALGDAGCGPDGGYVCDPIGGSG
jgi:hypothetical protein